MIGQLSDRMWSELKPRQREEKALATVASLIGAVVLARAVNDPKLSDDILRATKNRLERLSPIASGRGSLDLACPAPLNLRTPAMVRTIDFYFDFPSPYSYLAHTQLPKIAAEHGATVYLSSVSPTRVDEDGCQPTDHYRVQEQE